MESGNFVELLFAVMAALFLFGCIYNAFVARIEHDGQDRGFTAFLVVGGVLVTVVAAGLIIGLRDMAILLVCFSASGLPMIWGGWSRYTKTRQAEEKKAIEITRKLLDRGGL